MIQQHYFFNLYPAKTLEFSTKLFFPSDFLEKRD